jgi:DNA mismatch repair protein MutH
MLWRPQEEVDIPSIKDWVILFDVTVLAAIKLIVTAVSVSNLEMLI